MPKKKENYCVEISDILEPEQEDRVIEIVGTYLNKDYDALKAHFQSTDTVEVRRISKEKAHAIETQCNELELTTRIYSIDEKKKESEAHRVRCPRCGAILEYPDWRCPECYYEFPDYTFVGDDEEEE